MTDIDIERLRDWSEWREANAVHYEGCENSSSRSGGHIGCAILALIERLEKAESDALAWQDVAIKERAERGQAEAHRDRLQRLVLNAYEVLRAAKMTIEVEENKTDE